MTKRIIVSLNNSNTEIPLSQIAPDLERRMLALNAAEPVAYDPDAPPLSAASWIGVAQPHKDVLLQLWPTYRDAAAQLGVKADWEHFQRRAVELIESEAGARQGKLDKQLSRVLAEQITGAKLAPNAAAHAPAVTADQLSILRKLGVKPEGLVPPPAAAAVNEIERIERVMGLRKP